MVETVIRRSNPLGHLIYFRLLLLSLFALCSISCAGTSRDRRIGESGKIHLYYYPEQTRTPARDGGLRIWKSERREGPFAPLDGKLHRISNAKPDTAILLATDDRVRLGGTYFYYIEEVDSEGRGRKITSVMKAVATLPVLGDGSPSAAAAQPPGGPSGLVGRKAEATSR